MADPEPARLVGPVGAVQPQEEEDPLDRRGVLVQHGQLVDRPDGDVLGLLLGVVVEFTGRAADEVEVLGLPPVELAGQVQPAEEPAEFADVVGAGLPGHRRAVPLRGRAAAEDAEEFVRALVVEGGQIDVRQVALDRLDLDQLRLAVVADGAVGVPVFPVDVVPVGVEGLVERLAGQGRSGVGNGFR